MMVPSIRKHSTCVNALLIALGLGLGGTCIAQARTCSPKEAAAADALVDHLDSWKTIGTAFHQYGQCDHGSIAEGNSEAVARLLVDRWDTLPALTKLVKPDPGLKQFVLRHIDTTLDTDDLGKIDELASSRCPEGAAFFCKELRTAVVRAAK